MPQIGLHGFHIIAALKRNDGICMSQIVDADFLHAQFLDYSLEAIVNSTVRQSFPNLIPKYQVICILLFLMEQI